MTIKDIHAGYKFRQPRYPDIYEVTEIKINPDAGCVVAIFGENDIAKQAKYDVYIKNTVTGKVNNFSVRDDEDSIDWFVQPLDAPVFTMNDVESELLDQIDVIKNNIMDSFRQIKKKNLIDLDRSENMMDAVNAILSACLKEQSDFYKQNDDRCKKMSKLIYEFLNTI